jgi:hypothetical protein
MSRPKGGKSNKRLKRVNCPLMAKITKTKTIAKIAKAIMALGLKIRLAMIIIGIKR